MNILNDSEIQEQAKSVYSERGQSVVTYLLRGPCNWEEAPGKDSLSLNLGDIHVWYVPWRHTYQGSVLYVHDFCIIFKLKERSFLKKNNWNTRQKCNFDSRMSWCGLSSTSRSAPRRLQEVKRGGLGRSPEADLGEATGGSLAKAAIPAAVLGLLAASCSAAARLRAAPTGRLPRQPWVWTWYHRTGQQPPRRRMFRIRRNACASVGWMDPNPYLSRYVLFPFFSLRTWGIGMQIPRAQVESFSGAQPRKGWRNAERALRMLCKAHLPLSLSLSHSLALSLYPPSSSLLLEGQTEENQSMIASPLKILDSWPCILLSHLGQKDCFWPLDFPSYQLIYLKRKKREKERAK